MSTPTREASVQGTIPWQPGAADMESVLPELRAADWEVGIRRRAQTGVLGVFAEPGLIREAMRISCARTAPAHSSWWP